MLIYMETDRSTSVAKSDLQFYMIGRKRRKQEDLPSKPSQKQKEKKKKKQKKKREKKHVM